MASKELKKEYDNIFKSLEKEKSELIKKLKKGREAPIVKKS